MYEKPRIADISFKVSDTRRAGGTVVVDVSLLGDPGLAASFDISPGIAEGEPMQETAEGTYAGRFAFPPDLVGGPFAVIGRLRHEQAGEVVLRDETPLSISLYR
jgi:hypothetical protein